VLGRREAQCENISTYLSSVRSHQKAYRLRAESGRDFARVLNYRLALFASASTLGLVLVGIGQTIVLKRLFTPAKRTTKQLAVVDVFDDYNNSCIITPGTYDPNMNLFHQ
jgi:hypothetical protein